MSRGLGGRLRTLRESATLTREALAERSGVSVRTLAALELGTVAQPRVSTLRALADAFGLDDDARAELVALGRQPGPAGAPARPVPRELPPAAPDLAGRGAILETAASHLLTASGSTGGGPAVWVVSGPPGVGKTALALQVAHRIGPRFPDGQLFLALGAMTPSAGSLAVAALRRILTVTGLHPGLLSEDVDELAATMRSRLADARLLLVLDDVPGSVDLAPLLPAGPGSAVIVTARSLPVSVPAAGHQPLGPLGQDEAVELLAGLAGHSRVDAEPEEARRVVELCDRLPVALRVAGSRLAGRPEVTLRQMAAQLLDERSRLALLSSGDIGVRASLGAGYDSLAETERAVFHVLGELGTSSGPTWAVAAALDIDLASAVVSVERLVESGLVDSEGAGGRHRYRLHDLTRLLARERSELADSAQVRAQRWRRLLERWRELTHAATQRLPVLVDVAAELPPIEIEPLAPADLADVLDEPAAWLAATPSMLLRHVERAVDVLPADQVWPVPTVLWHCWRTSDVIDDAGPLLARVHAACVAAGDRHGEAVTLTLAGFDPYRRRDPRAIAEQLEQARSLLAQIGDPIAEVRALLLLATARARLVGVEDGGNHGDGDDGDEALSAAREAVALAGELSVPALLADAIAVLARLALGLGRLDEAHEVAERGRATLGEEAPAQWAAQLDWVQGTVLREHGLFEEAQDLLVRAHRFVVGFEDRWGMATIERDLADLLDRTGQPDSAADMLRACHEHAEAIGLDELAAEAAERLRQRGRDVDPR